MKLSDLSITDLNTLFVLNEGQRIIAYSLEPEMTEERRQVIDDTVNDNGVKIKNAINEKLKTIEDYTLLPINEALKFQLKAIKE